MRQKAGAERAGAKVVRSYSPAGWVATLTTGALGASVDSWTASTTVMLVPLAKVRVTGTDWAGNSWRPGR